MSEEDQNQVSYKILNIYLFKKDANLRIHTIKHFFDKEEIKYTWRQLMAIDESAIDNWIDELKGLGCPHYSNNSSAQLCIDCHLTGPCTEIIRDFEIEYLRIIVESIKAGGKIEAAPTLTSARSESRPPTKKKSVGIIEKTKTEEMPSKE